MTSRADTQSVTSEYSCGDCGLKFDKMTQLTKHHRDAHVKKFQCQLCEYRCIRKRDIEKHEATHAKPPVPERRKSTRTPVTTPRQRSPLGRHSPRRDSPRKDRASTSYDHASPRSSHRRSRSRSPRTNSSRSRKRTPSPRDSPGKKRRQSRSPKGATVTKRRENRSPRCSPGQTRSRESASEISKSPVMQQRRSHSPEETPVREQSPVESPVREQSESPDQKEVACQTDDEGSTKARIRNLLAHLRSAGHAGGSVIENSVVEFKVPAGLVLIRKTERFLSRHGELVESITEEIKKEPETQE